ncbi:MULTISPECIES: nucleotidyltransferase family protein [unclassified Coleofasciculus]|uniref:nucleotidyltransferase family protein n=1 Tax=unclassified Coleofasciculus TaxID=2692782 RepID=UPI001D14EA9F|nr:MULTISPECIES: DNA polymerase subunit beta [unclassified Coleofasciculus]
MAEDLLQELIKETRRLTLDEQLQLMKQLEQIVRSHDKTDSSQRLWGEIQHQREQILALATKQGASNVRVFDVGVRHDTSPAGEVNLLVNLEPGKSLLALAGLMVDLQELLGCDVYVTEEGGLKGEHRERVLQEAVLL